MNASILNASRRGPFWAPLLAVALGCSGSGRPAYEPPKGFNAADLVPVSGVVTLNGKPLATAMVTFLPKEGVPAVGETDREGRYALKSIRNRGAIRGEHRVAISYVVSADGEAMDMGERHAHSMSPAMQSASERLPREYSDLSRTKLRANVGPRGGTFNFDVQAPVEVAEKAPAEDARDVAKAREGKDAEKATEIPTKPAGSDANAGEKKE